MIDSMGFDRRALDNALVDAPDDDSCDDRFAAVSVDLG